MLKLFLKNDKGEAYVGEAVKIVIVIVLGAALLAGCVLIFNQAVLPRTESWIEAMFGEAKETIDKTSEDYQLYKEAVDREMVLWNEMIEEYGEAEFQAEYDAVMAEIGITDYPPDIKSEDACLFIRYHQAHDTQTITYTEFLEHKNTKDGMKDIYWCLNNYD